MNLLSALRYRVWAFCKQFRCKTWRKRFNNPGVSILSMNCIGGILYHDIGMRFLSPTINLYMRAEDFIKFCENLDYYLSIDEMVEITDSTIVGNRTYPIARLGDLMLFLVHYKSVEEARSKWNQRKKRLNRDNIVIFNNDREGMTPELMDRFQKLPYRKVMFVHKPVSGRNPDIFYYLHGYENKGEVGIITDPIGWKGLRAIDSFDWVSLLNGYK